MGLTPEQFTELQRVHESKDRTGFYIKYYEITGVDQSLEMAKISSFSGVLGGVAEAANYLIERDYPNLYHKGGVIKFSENIQSAVFEAVKASYINNNNGILSDLQMAEIAGHVWKNLKIGDKFPGNVEIVLEKLFDTKHAQWRKDGSLVKGLKEDVDKLLSKGTYYSAKGAYQYFTTDKFGKKASDFVGNQFYEKRFSPNFDTYYYIDKNTGTHVFIGETGAKKEGDFVYITGFSEEEVAQRFNIPVDRVAENYFANEDILGRPTGPKTFTILPDKTRDPSSTKHKANNQANQAEGDSLYENETPGLGSSWFDTSTYGMSSFGAEYITNYFTQAWASPSNDNTKRSTSYKIEKGDNLWNIARKHGTTVEALLLLPGNKKYLDRAKLNSKNEVEYVLIKEGEILELPKEGSKLYAGNAKQRLKKILKEEGEAEIKNVKTTTNKDGETITEIEEDAVIIVNEQELNPNVIIESDARQEAEQLKFILDNFIQVDEDINNIFKFTDKVYEKLFSPKNIEETSRIMTQQLLNGEKIAKVARNLLKQKMAEVTVEGVSLPAFSEQYDNFFSDKIGKDILSEFAINLLPTVGTKLSAKEYRMMAYSAATKVAARDIINSYVYTENAILKSTMVDALSGTALSFIALKGRLDGNSLSSIATSSIISYTGSTLTSGVVASLGASNLGLLGGPITAVVSFGLHKAFGKRINKFIKKIPLIGSLFDDEDDGPSVIVELPIEVSTFIESHSVRVNKDGTLEFITLRPDGTTIYDFGPADKIIYGRGNSDTILSGSGNDVIMLLGLSGGFVQSGNNKPRQVIKVKDPNTNQETETYIYLEKIIGSEGNDNNLDGQEGDDYISGMGGNDIIKGGSGHDLLEGGDGNDTIEGGDGDDTIDGGDGDDLINGGNGNDVIYAGNGDDGSPEYPINGGPGDDKISGGTGVDFIHGGDGNDIISGGGGIDFLHGGKGNDLISGDNGSDYIYGEEGNDDLEGGEGRDIIFGGKGNDLLRGGNGWDTLSGNEGDDLIYGDEGEDYIIGGEGNDKLYGGTGSDYYVYRVHEKAADTCIDPDKLYPGDGEDIIEDTSGKQDLLIIENQDISPKDLKFELVDKDLKISFKERNGSVTLKSFIENRGIEVIQLYGYYLLTAEIDWTKPNDNLNWVKQEISNESNVDTSEEEVQDWYKSYFDKETFDQLPKNIKANIIQAVTHTRYKYAEVKPSSVRYFGEYHVTHPQYPLKLEGDNSNNKLIGSYWGEHILGHGGNDEIYGNNGNDHIQAGSGDDYVEGGNGDDVIEGGEGNDKLMGGMGNDRIYGNQGSDELYGEWGNDKLYGGTENDSLDGGEGDDYLYGEEGDDILFGGVGDDTLYGGSGNDKLSGGDEEDNIYGEAGDDIIAGNKGDDKLYGGPGNDHAFGGEGNDKIYGNEGNDYLLGGEGNDEIYGGPGDDRIIGGHDLGNVNKCKEFSTLKEKLALETFCAKFASDTSKENNYLYGEEGNDYIRGSIGEDLIDGGEGDDEALGGPGNDKIYGGNGTDRLSGGIGNDEIHGGPGNDIITGDEGNDNLNGGEGDDEIYGGPGYDILKGGEGNDVLYGEEGDDHLYPGKPSTVLGIQTKNQILVGGPGQDTYYYNYGDGHIEIDDCGKDSQNCTYDQDTLKLGESLSIEDISIRQNENNAVITFNSVWGSIIIKNQFGIHNQSIASIEFSDGIRLPIDNILMGTKEDDSLKASNHNVIFADQGNDQIEVTGGQFVFGQEGRDEIKILGNNNRCYGGEGDDLYILTNTTTNSVIIDRKDNSHNSLKIASNVGIQDLLPSLKDDGLHFIWRNGSNAVTINYNTQGFLPIEQLTIEYFNITFPKISELKINYPNEVVYKGTDMSEWVIATDLNTRSYYGGKGNDIIIGHTDRGNVLVGEEGEDLLIGSRHNDSLEGGLGNDILYGGAGNDKLIGGPGDDHLYGGPGKDYFVYHSDSKLNQGKDKIYNFNCSEDSIELTTFGFWDTTYLPKLIYNVATDTNGNAIIEDKGNFHITLVGLPKTAVTAECFTFGFKKAEAVYRMYKFFERLPDVMVKVWITESIKQLSDNHIKDWREIKIPIEQNIPFFDDEDNESFINSFKEISYSLLQDQISASLPESINKAYKQLTIIQKAIKTIPTSGEMNPEAISHLNNARENLKYACQAYQESSTEQCNICNQYEAELLNNLESKIE